MGIIDVFEKWDHLFKKVKHEIMYFNHENSQYFMYSCFELTSSLMALSLFQFQFIITYDLGCQQRKLNILFCCSYFIHREGDVTYNQQCDVIFKLELLQIQVMFIILDDKKKFSHIHEDLEKFPLLLTSRVKFSFQS